jgi:predicted nucleotidyltransferase
MFVMVSSAQAKQEILSLLMANRVQILALGVRRLGLFGSFVRNEQTAESDIDFLVEFTPGEKTFDNFIRLSSLLEDLFQRRVELVTTEGLSPYIGPRILSEVEYVPLAA